MIHDQPYSIAKRLQQLKEDLAQLVQVDPDSVIPFMDSIESSMNAMKARLGALPSQLSEEQRKVAATMGIDGDLRKLAWTFAKEKAVTKLRANAAIPGAEPAAKVAATMGIDPLAFVAHSQEMDRKRREGDR